MKTIDFKTFLLSTIVLSTICSTTIGGPALGASQLSHADQSKLKILEENIFFKSYDDESDATRLARVEKRVFGDPSEGDPATRLSAIIQAAANLSVQAPPTVPNTSKPPGSATANSATASTSTGGNIDAFSAQDEERRQRLRAMAARDAEVNSLLAEGVTLFKNKRGNEAMTKFQQVIRLAPDNAEAYYSLGIGYEAQRNFAEACNSYQKAIELNPNKNEYRDALAVAQKKGAANQGKSELKQLAQDAADAYKRQEYFSAVDLYKQLDAKAPNQPLVKYNIGTIYMAMKNPVQALEYFQQAASLDPQKPAYQQAVMQLSASLGQEQMARRQAENAMAAQQGLGQQGMGQQNFAPQRQQSQWTQPGQIQSPMQQPMQSPMQQPMQNQAPSQAQNNLGKRGDNAPPSAAFGLLVRNTKGGAEISSVGLASRASKKGLLRGDIIKAVDGNVIESSNQLQQMLMQKGPCDQVQLLIQRGQKLGQVVL